MYSRLIREFAWADSFWRRIVFIDVCDGFVHLFSSRFCEVSITIKHAYALPQLPRPARHDQTHSNCCLMQAHVFEFCLRRVTDPIANVRLHILRLLPVLKQTIRLPDHVEKLV